MKVILERKNDDYLFEAKGKSGVPLLIDNTVDGVSYGSSPMELLLMGVGGCSAIDVIHILKKQRQKITSYNIEVSGEREEVKEAKPFTSMHVHIILEGEISAEKAIRAAKLSFEKYCSVSITLENCVKVSYAITLNSVNIVST
ncbi:MAG: OsmC family protein [Patiriisocius sp.]|uniref:OsmC family protein n=1 Tax=Patiriisocius sp. TaxID=2822396 RepID=UPI003EF30F78